VLSRGTVLRVLLHIHSVRDLPCDVLPMRSKIAPGPSSKGALQAKLSLMSMMRLDRSPAVLAGAKSC